MRPSGRASGATILRESDPIMPASEDGDVQSNETAGHKPITIKVAGDGRVACRQIYPETTSHHQARRRARALENIDNPKETPESSPTSLRGRRLPRRKTDWPNGPTRCRQFLR